ncbi:MAG: hypothetical protein M0006_05330 [Magnetospirillum sp.]|nr:hypothetical protein [Magnetospirillum sp.]
MPTLADDFEDDGASFRVRRERQLAALYPAQTERMRRATEYRAAGAAMRVRVAISAAEDKRPPMRLPLVLRLSLWLVAGAALVFGAIVAAVLGMAIIDNLPTWL